MRCDTHTHSLYSFDGRETVAQLCTRAAELGIRVFAVTDHSEAMEGVAFHIKERERVARQRDAVLAAREAFPELTLLHGCELGQPHLSPEYARDILRDFDFDYVIGSLHFFHGNVDLYDVEYTRENYQQWLRKYFDETMEMLRFGGFHSLGHLDYILRRMKACFNGKPTYRGFEEQIREILKLVARQGMALEVNTSGLRQWFGALGLELWVLQMFREAGGKYVTIGSDAHVAGDVGAGFEEAVELVRAAGFTGYTYFKHGEPVLAPVS